MEPDRTGGPCRNGGPGSTGGADAEHSGGGSPAAGWPGDPALFGPGSVTWQVHDGFLRAPTVHPLLVPARALLGRRVAQTAYASLPPYAHELYGRSVRSPRAVTRRLRLTGTVLRCVPARLRWQLPPKHIIRAMSRLGPGSRPAPYKVGP